MLTGTQVTRFVLASKTLTRPGRSVHLDLHQRRRQFFNLQAESHHLRYHFDVIVIQRATCLVQAAQCAVIGQQSRGRWPAP